MPSVPRLLTKNAKTYWISIAVKHFLGIMAVIQLKSVYEFYIQRILHKNFHQIKKVTLPYTEKAVIDAPLNVQNNQVSWICKGHCFRNFNNFSVLKIIPKDTHKIRKPHYPQPETQIIRFSKKNQFLEKSHTRADDTKSKNEQLQRIQK